MAWADAVPGFTYIMLMAPSRALATPILQMHKRRLTKRGTAREEQNRI